MFKLRQWRLWRDNSQFSFLGTFDRILVQKTHFWDPTKSENGTARVCKMMILFFGLVSYLIFVSGNRFECFDDDDWLSQVRLSAHQYSYHQTLYHKIHIRYTKFFFKCLIFSIWHIRNKRNVVNENTNKCERVPIEGATKQHPSDGITFLLEIECRRFK